MNNIVQRGEPNCWMCIFSIPTCDVYRCKVHNNFHRYNDNCIAFQIKPECKNPPKIIDIDDKQIVIYPEDPDYNKY